MLSFLLHCPRIEKMSSDNLTHSLKIFNLKQNPFNQPRLALRWQLHCTQASTLTANDPETADLIHTSEKVFQINLIHCSRNFHNYERLLDFFFYHLNNQYKDLTFFFLSTYYFPMWKWPLWQCMNIIFNIYNINHL